MGKAKKLKALRRQAKNETVGQPMVKYTRSKGSYTIRVQPNTTRGRYLQLKRAAVQKGEL